MNSTRIGPKTLALVLGALCLLASCTVPRASAEEASAQEVAKSHKVRLGARLFFDNRLSADQSVSCASCHDPDKAFADGRPVSKGAFGRLGSRNAPSLIDVGSVRTSLMWDGRRANLEEQSTAPILNTLEHAIGSPSELVHLIESDSEYTGMFRQAFGVSTIRLPHVAEALAAFQRTIVADDSEFDRFAVDGQPGGYNDAAKRGLTLFAGRAGCSECHRMDGRPASFTDGKFHAVQARLADLGDRLPELLRGAAQVDVAAIDQALENLPEYATLGRFMVTRDPRDIGAFRTPSLRNVALTAPYMHDGSVATLEEAVEIEIYYRGIKDQQRLALTLEERADLVAFLRSLTSSGLDVLAAHSRRLAAFR